MKAAIDDARPRDWQESTVVCIYLGVAFALAFAYTGYWL